MKHRLTATVLLTAVMVSTLSVTSGASAPNPQALMKSVLADGDAQTSVRFATSSSFMNFSQVTDAGRTEGRQTISLTISGKKHTVIIELIGVKLFVKGDAAILVSYIGLPKATSNQLAGKWFEVPTANPMYAQFALGLTLSSAMSEINLTRSVTAGPSTVVSNVSVETLRGLTPKLALEPSFKETLYVTTSKQPLPVEAVQIIKTVTATDRFSNWNEAVSVVAPRTNLQLG